MAFNTLYNTNTGILGPDLSPDGQTCTSSHLFQITVGETDRYLKLRMSK